MDHPNHVNFPINLNDNDKFVIRLVSLFIKRKNRPFSATQEKLVPQNDHQFPPCVCQNSDKVSSKCPLEMALKSMWYHARRSNQYVVANVRKSTTHNCKTTCKHFESKWIDWEPLPKYQQRAIPRANLIELLPTPLGIHKSTWCSDKSRDMLRHHLKP